MRGAQAGGQVVPPKAKRSFDHARLFLSIGVGTPYPVGYLNVRRGLLFDRSYYVTFMSDCPHTYNDLFYQDFDYADEVVRALKEKLIQS